MVSLDKFYLAYSNAGLECEYTREDVVKYVKETYGLDIVPENWDKIYLVVKHSRRLSKVISKLSVEDRGKLVLNVAHLDSR